MATEWVKADNLVLEIVRDVMGHYHNSLLGARIGIVMRDFAPRTNGKVTYGKAKKISEQDKVFMPYDFVIWFANDTWQELTAMQKQALVDHKLSHCVWDEFEGASMRAHDIEEFTHIIERYGFWWPHPERFQEAVQAALLITPEATRNHQNGSVESMPVEFANAL